MADQQTNKRYTIGLLAENSTWRSDSLIADGARETAKQCGVNFVYLGLYGQPDQHDEPADSQAARGSSAVSPKYDILKTYIDLFDLDGLLIIGWSKDFHDAAERAEFREIVGDLPVVSLGKELDAYPFVHIPGYLAVKAMTEHLIHAHGHRKIAFIESYNGTDDRTEAYRDAMREAGIIEENLLVRHDEMPKTEKAHVRSQRAIEILLDERSVAVDAIIVMSASEGSLILPELKSRGLRVPEDIAVCCYEDDISTWFSDPPLTTVYYPYHELGQNGCRKLLRMLRGEPVDQADIAYSRVVYRHSCGCLHHSINEEHEKIFHNFLAKDQSNQTLMFMGRTILAAYHIPKILELTENYFGWLQIPTGFLFQYKQGRCELLFASENYQNTTSLYNNKTNLADVFQAFKQNGNEPFTLTAFPLLIGDEPIGYTWLEPGSNDASTVLTLFDFIKTAVKNSELWEESQKHINQLAVLADTDGLTGLFNRRFFYDVIQAAVRKAEPFSLFFFDIDGFKGVNDTFGHAAGDRLLTLIAERIKEVLEPFAYPLPKQVKFHPHRCTIFRLGGDEFTALLRIADRSRLTDLAQRLIETIGAPYDISGSEVRISCSVGISLFPENGKDGDYLLRQADTAMYKAKTVKNTYLFI